MIDTHTHLYMPEFDADGQPAGAFEGQVATVDRAVAAGVEKMIFANVDAESVAPIRSVASLRPDNVAVALGLHPTEVGDDWREELAVILAAAPDMPSVVAIGECGIDLYWDKTNEDKQMQAFESQLAIASDVSLPVIIHSREGLDRTLEVLKGFPGVPAVFHSFGGSEADVDRILAQGDYYFGINGIVTFKNSRLREVLPYIGINRLLTETDAPFLAPVPFRGKRNESAMMTKVVDEIARSLSMEPAEVDRITTQNAYQLFQKLQ